MIYKGQLAYHTEQGCGAWIQFHDNRGLHGDKKQYWNWDWTINFSNDTKLKNIKVINNDGEEVYNGPWTGIRTTKLECKELTKETIIPWLTQKYTAIITTDEVLKGYTKWASTQADKILLDISGKELANEEN